MCLIYEAHEMYHIKEYTTKLSASRKYNPRVVPREIKGNNLTRKQVVAATRTGKLLSNLEGPYRVHERLTHDT